MIDKFVIGRGKARKVIDMVRDKDQRKSAAGALKGFLFPTQADHQRAMDAGRKRAKQYSKDRFAPVFA